MTKIGDVSPILRRIPSIQGICVQDVVHVDVHHGNPIRRTITPAFRSWDAGVTVAERSAPRPFPHAGRYPHHGHAATVAE